MAGVTCQLTSGPISRLWLLRRPYVVSGYRSLANFSISVVLMAFVGE